MAATSTTIWRIRISGSDANGGGFDPSVSVPGTDYSQQDAAQVTYTDLVIGAANSLTSAGTPFTSAHVGNVIVISGGTGFTVGRYVVASVSGSTATMNASPGTNGSTSGTGKLGGGLAFAGAFGANATPPAIASAAQPGNTVYIRGAGSDTGSSWPTTGLDYNVTGYFTPTEGTFAAGMVRWVGENGRPTIGCNGLLFFSIGYQKFENLYFCITATGTAGFGVVNGSASKPVYVRNCFVNLNDKTGGYAGIQIHGSITDSAIYGGTATPVFNAGTHGIVPLGTGTQVAGCSILNCRDCGISPSSGAGSSTILRNTIANNAGDGIAMIQTGASVAGTSIVGNTIDGNLGHGISLTGVGGIAAVSVFNNEITNHVTALKYGLNVSDGAAALNDNRAKFCDFNNFSGNTGGGNRNGISAGASDTAVDPGYTNRSGRDWSPTNAAVQAGFPPAIRGTLN